MKKLKRLWRMILTFFMYRKYITETAKELTTQDGSLADLSKSKSRFYDEKYSGRRKYTKAPRIY